MSSQNHNRLKTIGLPAAVLAAGAIATGAILANQKETAQPTPVKTEAQTLQQLHHERDTLALHHYNRIELSNPTTVKGSVPDNKATTIYGLKDGQNRETVTLNVKLEANPAAQTVIDKYLNDQSHVNWHGVGVLGVRLDIPGEHDPLKTGQVLYGHAEAKNQSSDPTSVEVYPYASDKSDPEGAEIALYITESAYAAPDEDLSASTVTGAQYAGTIKKSHGAWQLEPDAPVQPDTGIAGKTYIGA